MTNYNVKFDRRSILKGFGIGAAYMAMGSQVFAPKSVYASARSRLPGKDELFLEPAEPAKVAIKKGNDRREIVRAVLDNIKDDISYMYSFKGFDTHKILSEWSSEYFVSCLIILADNVCLPAFKIFSSLTAPRRSKTTFTGFFLR